MSELIKPINAYPTDNLNNKFRTPYISYEDKFKKT
jgi:hypothetical protein